MQTVRYSSLYKVTRDNVQLKVTIGEAQPGVVVMLMNERFEHHDGILDIDLGAGASLNDKTLRLTTIVTHRNEHTGNTSVTYKLTGGSVALVHTDTCEVVDNASADYEARITFVFVG